MVHTKESLRCKTIRLTLTDGDKYKSTSKAVSEKEEKNGIPSV